MATQPSAIACDLTALTPEEREQHIANSLELFAAIGEVQELPDGYAFRLPEDSVWLPKLAEFIRYDRLCCSFIRYGVDVQPHHGDIWLQLSGTEGVKAFLAAEFGDLLPAKIASDAGFSVSSKT